MRSKPPHDAHLMGKLPPILCVFSWISVTPMSISNVHEKEKSIATTSATSSISFYLFTISLCHAIKDGSVKIAPVLEVTRTAWPVCCLVGEPAVSLRHPRGFHSRPRRVRGSGITRTASTTGFSLLLCHGERKFYPRRKCGNTEGTRGHTDMAPGVYPDSRCSFMAAL